VDHKQEVSQEISRLLGTPIRRTANGGTVTRPFLDDVAHALGVDTRGLHKVGVTRAIMARLDLAWRDEFASTASASGGGGNVTLDALKAIHGALSDSQRNPALPHEDQSEVHTPAEFLTPTLTWSTSFTHVAENLEPFEPDSIEDARDRVFAEITRRRGQDLFRRRLVRAYNGKCAITGCAATVALEAAHIVPYRGHETNRVDNGLLLRADIHTLFDLGFIGIDPDTRRILVSSALHKTEYDDLEGRLLAEPRDRRCRPDISALQWRRHHIGPTES
jgi:hypothetical protein